LLHGVIIRGALAGDELLTDLGEHGIHDSRPQLRAIEIQQLRRCLEVVQTFVIVLLAKKGFSRGMMAFALGASQPALPHHRESSALLFLDSRERLLPIALVQQPLRRAIGSGAARSRTEEQPADCGEDKQDDQQTADYERSGYRKENEQMPERCRHKWSWSNST